MTRPIARIVHQTADRLRLRITTRRGDPTYFDRLETVLTEKLEGHAVRCAPETAGLLITAPAVDMEKLAEAAAEAGLFELSGAPISLAEAMSSPVRRASNAMGTLTGNAVDLPGAIFLGLLGYGVVALARGNLRMPPWYTAFWYAFGIFTKSIADKTFADASFPQTPPGTGT